MQALRGDLMRTLVAITSIVQSGIIALLLFVLWDAKGELGQCNFDFWKLSEAVK